MLTIFSCLAGIWLGANFGVLILIPLIACGTLSLAVYAFSLELSLHEIVISGGIPLLGLQGGYMIGLTGRDMIAQFRNWVDSFPIQARLKPGRLSPYSMTCHGFASEPRDC